MVSKAKILADITNTSLNANKENKDPKRQYKKKISSEEKQQTKEHNKTKIFEELQIKTEPEVDSKVKPKSKSKTAAAKKHNQPRSTKPALQKRQKVSEALESSQIPQSGTSDSDYKLSLTPAASPVSKPKKRDLKPKKSLFSTNKSVQRQFGRLSRAKDLFSDQKQSSQEAYISDGDYHVVIEVSNAHGNHKVQYKQQLKKVKKTHAEGSKKKLISNKCKQIQVHSDSDDREGKINKSKNHRDDEDAHDRWSAEEESIEDSSQSSSFSKE